MPAQTTVTAQPRVAIRGLIYDFDSGVDGVVSFEAATDLPAGHFVSLDANGRAVLSNGSLPVIGVVVAQTTNYAPHRAGTIVPIMRKGRIFAALASGATAPTFGAVVSRHATSGEVVSAGGTSVNGAFGYARGTTAMLPVPADCCLIELNLPSVAPAP